MSAVGIVVTPSVQPSNAYQEIGFLGPILEKTAFDFMTEGISPQSETLYAKSAYFSDKIRLKPKGPGRKVLKEFVPGTSAGRAIFFERATKNIRDIQFHFTEGAGISIARMEKEEAPFVLEGPAGGREILFKPDPPALPRGLYGSAEEYYVKLKFFVSNDGAVYDVKPIASSGYPEIDLGAMRFLKRWRFSPLGAPERGVSSTWGIVSVRISTRG